MRITAYIFGLVALLAVAACSPSEQNSANVEQRQTEVNQSSLTTKYPAPKLAFSAERKNLKERLERLNTENLTGCIYLIDHGAVMAFYPVRNKVTSLNAYLSGDTRPVWFGSGFSGTSNSFPGWQMVESPDYDGAYGKNADGIFFFTADTDALVEWSGTFLWSDQCLAPQQQPQLVRQVTGK